MSLSPTKLSLALAFALLAPCALPAAEPGPAVATVNGKPITLARYRGEVSQIMADWKRSNPGLPSPNAKTMDAIRKSVLGALIGEELELEAAGKQGVKVSEADMERGVAQAKASFRRDQFGNEVPDKEAQKAFESRLKAMGLDMKGFRKQIKKELAIRKLIEQKVIDKVDPPTDKEITSYFEKVKKFLVSGSTVPPSGMDRPNRMAFMQIAQGIKELSSERVRLSVILVRIAPDATPAEKQRALSAIQGIRKDLVSGETSFAEVARAKSEDPLSAPRGGDIGYVYRFSPLPKEMIDAAFSLKVGEISKPIATDFGDYIIRVEEVRAGFVPYFEKFKDMVGEALMNFRIQQAGQAYVKQLKDKAKITENKALISTVE